MWIESKVIHGLGKRCTRATSPALLKDFDMIVKAALKTAIETTLPFSGRDFKLAERLISHAWGPSTFSTPWPLILTTPRSSTNQNNEPQKTALIYKTPFKRNKLNQLTFNLILKLCLIFESDRKSHPLSNVASKVTKIKHTAINSLKGGLQGEEALWAGVRGVWRCEPDDLSSIPGTHVKAGEEICPLWNTWPQII